MTRDVPVPLIEQRYAQPKAFGPFSAQALKLCVARDSVLS